MHFTTVGASILVAFAVFQGINAYSEKAEEALKNLTDYELLLPQTPGKGGATGSLSVALNAASSVTDFWSDRLIQAANQANQVQTYTLPEFIKRVENIDTIDARISVNAESRIKDGKTVFDVAAMPIRTAIEIISVIKKVPVEQYAIDKVRELVQGGVDVLLLVKPELTKNNSAYIASAKEALQKVTKDLYEFTPEYIRKKCYPNYVCVANLLTNLKTSVENAATSIAKTEGLIITSSLVVNNKIDEKIREEEEKINIEARKWAGLELKNYAIDRTTIGEYYVGVIVKQNPSSKQVQEIINSAVTIVNELKDVVDYGKNTSRNTIFASGYPVVDAYNTVLYLHRNQDGKVLGNELIELDIMLNEIYQETVKVTPDFSAEIQAFYDEIKGINLTSSTSTPAYLEQTINETFIGDLVDYYLLYAGVVYDQVPQPINEAQAKINELLKKVEEKLPQITIAFSKLQAALNIRVQKLHEEVLYSIANRLYKGGRITPANIFYFGSKNLNATYIHWEALIAAEQVRIEEAYQQVLRRNYASYSIRDALINITQEVLDVLASYEDLFGSELVKKRSAVAVAQLIDSPSKDYDLLIKYNTENITELYNARVAVVSVLPALNADRIEFLNKGIQYFSSSKAPLVEQSHYHSVKVYRSKLALNRVYSQLEKIRQEILADEAIIRGAAAITLQRIQHIATEYINILHKYAKLKKAGEKFIADIPSISVVAYRILKEFYGFIIEEVPDFTEDIVKSFEEDFNFFN